MMKKFTVVLFASMILGAFGACKNEPDNIYVTPPLPIDPHEVGSENAGPERLGIGGDHATTTKLWFKLDKGNFGGSKPQDVVYTGTNGEIKEISISPTVTSAGVELGSSSGNYYVYSAEIHTPITENGLVSFDLSSEPGSGVPYEYHAHVIVPVYYAESVQVEVEAKNGNANRGTTELTVKLVDKANAKLSAIYVNGEKTPVSSDGVASITNRTTGNNPVRVSVKNEYLSSADPSRGYYIKGTDGYTDLPLSVGITPAIPFSVTFEANGEAGKRGTTALKLTAVKFSDIAASNYSISVGGANVASAVGTEVTIENRSSEREKPEVKVVLVEKVGLEENAVTNGYADFEAPVIITPAVPFNVTFEANGEAEKRGTTELKLTAVGFPDIAASNYSISVDGVSVDPAVGTVTIKNRSSEREKPEVKVVLVEKVGLEENAVTNGYANFTDKVNIIKAVRAVTFEKGDGVKDVFGTTELVAVNHVDKNIVVSIDEKPETIPPGGTTGTTILAIKNNAVEKKTVSVELTDSAANNGYYIQPASVDIVSAVEIKRAYPFGPATESYTDRPNSGGYVYYFAANPAFPASFLKPENVTVKSKEGAEGTVSKFCLAKDGGTDLIADWLGELTGNYGTYAIGFTLPSESSEVTFQFNIEEENGFYISELPSKL
jgi:hypothetical protein